MSESARLRALAGEYEIVRTIATGGMGSVHEVKSRRTGQRYAAKVLLKDEDARARERFRREAELLARCDRHPGIVKVHALLESNEGGPSLIMDFVEGESLERLLDRGGKLDPRRALEIALGLAEALGFAHERGIVHRDVKPANVLVDAEGKPRLTDFGLATARDVDRLTRTGQFVGTVLYCAPEQTSRQKGEPEPNADVYSLGAVLFHMLAGEPPVLAESVMAVLSALHGKAPVRDVRLLAPETPAELAAIVARCLEKRPERRYANGTEVARALAVLRAGETASDADAPGRGENRRLRGGVLVAVGLGAVALAAALVTMRRSPGSGEGTGADAIAVARSAVAAGDGQAALAALEKAPAPAGADADLVRGRALLLVGRAAEAEKVARDAPPSRRAEARELEGDALLAQKKFTAAQIAYSSVLDDASGEELRLKRARAAALAGDDVTALADFAKLVPDPHALPRERARNARFAAFAPLLYRRGLRVSSSHARDLDAAWRIAAPAPEDVAGVIRAWAEDAGRIQKELANPLSAGEGSVEHTFGLFLQVVPLWARIDELDGGRNVAAYWDVSGLIHAWAMARRWDGVPNGPELADAVLAEAPVAPVLAFLAARVREPFRARWREAIELYERASEAFPESRPDDAPEAVGLALDIAEGALRLDEALGDNTVLTPERIVRVVERARSGHVWSAFAMARARRGDLEKAWADQVHAEALAAADEDRWIGHNHIDILVGLGKLDEALSWARALQEGRPSTEKLEVLCYALRTAGRYDEMVALEGAPRKPSSSDRTATDLANSIIDAHGALWQFDAAREKARLLREVQPDGGNAALARIDDMEAVALRGLGRTPEALAASVERLCAKTGGITADERKLAVRAILGVITKRSWPLGCQLAVSLTEGATDPALLVARGKALTLLRRFDEAKAVALGPLATSRRQTLEVTTFLLEAQMGKDEAFTFLTYEQERARDEDSLRLLDERLLARSPVGTPEHDADCDEIVRRIPVSGVSDAKLLETIAFAYADRGAFGKAFELGRPVSKKRDDGGHRLIGAILGRVRLRILALLEDGKKEAALALARQVQAAGIPPSTEDVFRMWVHTLSRVEAYPELVALVSPERVGDAEPLVFRAAALHAMGRKDEALAYAAAATTKSSVALGSRAVFLLQEGKRDEAIALLRARRSDPDAVIAIRVLCDFLERKGDLAPIRELVDPARSTDLGCLVSLARALVGLGHRDEARALGERLVKGPPTSRVAGLRVLEVADE